MLEHSPDFPIVRTGRRSGGQNRQRHQEYNKDIEHDTSKDRISNFRASARDPRLCTGFGSAPLNTASAVSLRCRPAKRSHIFRAFAGRQARKEGNTVKKALWTLLVLAAIGIAHPCEDAMAQENSVYINAVDLDIVPSERDKFLEAIAEDAAQTIKEPGCLQFDVLVLKDDPNHLFLYEVYRDEAAFRAHREADYFKTYLEKTASMVAKRVTRTMTSVSLGQKGHD
jgi:quinol monooxygenase YgiN